MLAFILLYGTIFLMKYEKNTAANTQGIVIFSRAEYKSQQVQLIELKFQTKWLLK